MSAVVELKPVNKDFMSMDVKELGHELDMVRKTGGITFVEIGKQIGYERTTISNFVNQGKASGDITMAIRKFLTMYYNSNSEAESEVKEFKQNIELFGTTELQKILGFCEDMKQRRKIGCIVGYPGSGKTTAVKQYTEMTPGALYVEAFESMRINDLLEVLSEGMGIALKRGSNYKKIQQIIDEYDGRDIILVIDEAEYLKKWDVSKFDVLRKIWDNTGIPMIFCGTDTLEDYLTHGGSGKENLSQLYRRIYKIRLEGIREKEVREILKSYNIDAEAENLLVALAIDVKHGGMGNFTEILELCLQETQGEIITGSIVRNAKNYKMLY